MAVLAAVAVLVLADPAQSAEPPPSFFTQFPSSGEPGSGAGQLDDVHGIATSPATGRIFVADTNNRRVSEFTAWGEFVKAFGWGVRDGTEEPQTCTTATGCQAGLTGDGPGQFGKGVGSQYVSPTGIAVDSAGDLYVMDLGNFRVQKFNSDGEFLLMFGGDVNETTGGNLCTAASGDTCATGQLGTEPGAFSIENLLGTFSAYVAVAPDDTVFVGDRNRIQKFDSEGAYDGELPLPEPGNPGALAIDPTNGNLYFAFNQYDVGPPPTQPGIYRLNPDTGAQVGAVVPVQVPIAIATDPQGNLFAVEDPPGGTKANAARVVKFNPGGEKQSEFAQPDSVDLVRIQALATGSVGSQATDIDVYVAKQRQGVISLVEAYGPVPDPDVVGDPPEVPPQIAEEFAAAVGTTTATVRARINPNFWNDTAYYVEYGLQDCEVGPCQSTAAAPGTTLTAQVTNSPVLSGGVSLPGLSPGTTYHYRFVAQSSGGGPVVGPGRTFTTAKVPPPPNTACANQPLRSGPSALLPDCRAYEMVSPVDKLGSDIVALENNTSTPAELNQSTPAGAKLTYSAYKAFADPVASPYSSQYIASRGAEGWANRSISPPRSGPTLLELSGLDVQFKAFSAELCEGWFLQDTDHQLAPESVAGYPNLYTANVCSSPTAYEAITRVAPPAQPANEYLFELQGTGGGHTVFRANDKLTPNAPAGTAPKVYDYLGGALAYVCILPNGTALATGCSVGTASGGVPVSERNGSVHNAVSADGSRIFWSANGSGTGKLYLRSSASQTIAVSKGTAQFWGASADGGRAIFSEGGTLYGFEVGEDAPEDASAIAAGLVGVAGMSEDASRVYFVSTEALDGGAEAGKPNLYLAEEGEGLAYIATLSSVDVDLSNKFPSVVQPQPRLHAAYSSPSGNALTFISNNGLTGQDSLDVKSAQPDSQVYLYDAATETLRCVSCNPTGARPAGRDIIDGSSEFWAAAYLPAWANQLYAPRPLADDGQRVFFTSFDSLVLADTNGAADVYQWEATGRGDCTEPEGCISLISSGKSPEDSVFVDASATGDDVFFKTQESLVAQDPGLIDIYDARAGGGFAPPPAPPTPCQGEACQNPAPAPQSVSPSSSQFFGPPNPKAAKKPRPCAKGKHKVKRGGKVRCVKKGAKRKAAKRHSRSARSAKATRQAGRR